MNYCSLSLSLLFYTQNNILLTAPFLSASLYFYFTHPQIQNMSSKMSLFCHKYRQFIFLCLILFASSNSFFTHLIFMAQGRPIHSNLNQVAKNHGMEENGSMMLVEKFQIGSRPPKCEKRCTNCVHCEAVQVPIVPSKVQIQRRSHYYSEAKVIYSSRGDGLSNYKPISWKCKCGDYFFNP